MPSGNSTVKWIVALSISIIMAFAGWTFAAVNGSKANNIEKRMIEVDRNTLDIGSLKTQYGVVITKLEYIEKAVEKIEELLKK